jgi:hypothetical protein
VRAPPLRGCPLGLLGDGAARAGARPRLRGRPAARRAHLLHGVGVAAARAPVVAVQCLRGGGGSAARRLVWARAGGERGRAPRRSAARAASRCWRPARRRAPAPRPTWHAGGLLRSLRASGDGRARGKGRGARGAGARASVPNIPRFANLPPPRRGGRNQKPIRGRPRARRRLARAARAEMRAGAVKAKSRRGAAPPSSTALVAPPLAQRRGALRTSGAARCGEKGVGAALGAGAGRRFRGLWGRGRGPAGVQGVGRPGAVGVGSWGRQPREGPPEQHKTWRAARAGCSRRAQPRPPAPPSAPPAPGARGRRGRRGGAGPPRPGRPRRPPAPSPRA